MERNIRLKFRHRKMRLIPGKTSLQDKDRLLMCLTIQVRVKIPDVIVSARLNTLRLLNRNGWDYKFIIRNADTGAEVWSYNLMTLLSIARPTSRYDGTELPFQEYLDRQSEWNLIFTVVENPGGGFLQIGSGCGHLDFTGSTGIEV